MLRGVALWLADIANGDKELQLIDESEHDFYLGRTIGDAISLIWGAKETEIGFATIGNSIFTGGAVTVCSGGTLAVGGVTISVGGVAVGVVEILHGGVILYSSVNNLYGDSEKLNELGKTERKKPISGSKKDRATDVPSWARGEAPLKNENGKKFAIRLCDERYGAGNYETGPTSDYNQIKKWGDRNFK